MGEPVCRTEDHLTPHPAHEPDRVAHAPVLDDCGVSVDRGYRRRGRPRCERTSDRSCVRLDRGFAQHPNSMARPDQPAGKSELWWHIAPPLPGGQQEIRSGHCLVPALAIVGIFLGHLVGLPNHDHVGGWADGRPCNRPGCWVKAETAVSPRRQGAQSRSWIFYRSGLDRCASTNRSSTVWLTPRSYRCAQSTDGYFARATPRAFRSSGSC